MSVFRRKTSAGETKEFHYRFMKGGKSYLGVCKGCYDEESAKAYEANIRKTADLLATQRNVKALVENFREELSGGVKIELSKAFAEAMQKPRNRSASESHIETKKSQFRDFVKFMRKRYPEIKWISQVTRQHAESYISQLRTKGRFDKRVVCESRTKKRARSEYRSSCEKLSPATVNRFHKTIREVFSLLLEDAGLTSNPFAAIPMMREEQETREAFSEEELELIIKEAPEFVRNIFLVGFFTAFREGDIATLRWSDVLWELGIIRKKLLKTGVIVEVPILPPLRQFLQEQSGKDPEFVLPEHAAMYARNPSGISYRVKKFLEEDLHIQTSKKLPGRSRAVSVKDVHSLRHTFCYFAGVAGIPLVVVQSIVGHLTPEMTAHYTAHADRETKRSKMTLLPHFAAMIGETRRVNLIEQTRAALIEKIRTADDETLNRLAAILIPPKPKMSPLHNTALGKPRR